MAAGEKGEATEGVGYFFFPTNRGGDGTWLMTSWEPQD
jgi:hypothetical protein